MIVLNDKKIYLACGHTDMRKSINGLLLLVQGRFTLDPFDKAMFVFCNRSRDRLKILEWDGDGFWLHLKRLEKGHFKWPAILFETEDNSEKTMSLGSEELILLLGGPRLEQKLRRKEIEERQIL